MKQLIAIAFVFLIATPALAQKELNVMTFNIRYDNKGDSMNAWPYRKDNAASQVLFHKVHLLGVQEALHHQLLDLKMRLKHFAFVGVGRNDGKQKGEYSAIFYDSLRLQLLHSETFWLAEKTNVPGLKGWDASFERIVTWAKFKDRKSKKVFYHFNTHFDHMGKVARRESAKLLLQKVKEIAGNTAAIITGDFNATPGDEPVQVLVDESNVDRFIDANKISKETHYGPTGTFNAFKNKETTNEPIDYIFLKNKIDVLQHATLSQSWQGRFSSDHFPVFAVLRLR